MVSEEMTETCREMFKNTVDVSIKSVALVLKFIFVAKYPYPTHFKIDK